LRSDLVVWEMVCKLAINISFGRDFLIKLNIMKLFLLRIVRIILFALALLFFLPASICMFFYWFFTGKNPYDTILAESIYIGINSENPIEDLKNII